MKGRVLMNHGCWAAAVAAAFVAGSMRKAAPSASEEAALAKSTLGALAIRAPSGGADARVRPGARLGGPMGDSPVSRVESLFPVQGAPSSAAELKSLAEQAFKDANPVVRRLAFSRLLAAMTPENAQELRQHLVDLDADRDEWRDFHYAWGAMAGEEAFRLASESEEDDMEAVMSGWAASNPREAMALLDRLPEEMQGSRDDLEASVVSGLADNDLNLATDFVVRLANEGNERADDLINIVARELLRASSPEEATRWSESLPDGPMKGAAMDRVAGALVRDDPVAAAEWAERFAGEEYAVRVIEEVGDEWAERDPVEAVAWLERLPSTEGQREGLESAFDEWADRDAVAAGEYLLGMSPSVQRDAAISGFVREYARRDPMTSIAWAQDISDPGLRERAMTRAGQSYFRRDPEAAQSWLPQSGLPPEAQERITNPRRRR